MDETTECSSIGQIILQDRPSRDATDAAFISLTPIESSIFDSSKHRIRKIGLHIGPAHTFRASPTDYSQHQPSFRSIRWIPVEGIISAATIRETIAKNLIEITLSVLQTLETR